MSYLKGVGSIIYPARDLESSIHTWTQALGTPPAYQTPDFAAFFIGESDIGLSRLPWFDQPLVFWKVDNIEEARRALIAGGATPMGEIADRSMAELGRAPVTNGDPETGIVDVPGRRLAVLKAADGSLIGILQAEPMA